jgi:hypothetical protein
MKDLIMYTCFCGNYIKLYPSTYVMYLCRISFHAHYNCALLNITRIMRDIIIYLYWDYCTKSLFHLWMFWNCTQPDEYLAAFSTHKILSPSIFEVSQSFKIECNICSHISILTLSNLIRNVSESRNFRLHRTLKHPMQQIVFLIL